MCVSVIILQDDVEKMIADFVEKDLRSCRVVEEKSLPPSLRYTVFDIYIACTALTLHCTLLHLHS